MSKSSSKESGESERNDSVAIVGMACIFPGAANLEMFWSNIVGAVDSIREPGTNEWDARFYKQKSKNLFGNIYCSRAGFISEYAEFDPLEFGIMPASLKGSDPDQFLALRVAAEALQDAGYNAKSFESDTAEIIIGRTMAPGVGSLNLIQHGQTVDQIVSVIHQLLPDIDEAKLSEVSAKLHAELNPCSPDTIPALMPNILAGRIASKLGFRGRNLVLDAACASSLIAVEMAVQSLLKGNTELAIAGGIHINSSPYFAQMFCELGALSHRGVIRPFDEDADGTMLGEGVGMVVLKRLSDALADNNKIYAILKGIGSSSDGRGGGSLAPNAEGEALAMLKAYQMAAISPASVELLEAHGTGTRAGDKAEMKAIEMVFGAASQQKAWCGLGTIKSMIGHTQAASGIAGLIKTALALHHKTLPPSLHFEKPNSQIDWNNSPCYVLTEAKPWVKNDAQANEPRRAAVSAFGFGGINAHAVLEEFAGAAKAPVVAPQKKKARAGIKLSLKYPEISGKTLEPLNLREALNTTPAEKELNSQSKAVLNANGKSISQSNEGRETNDHNNNTVHQNSEPIRQANEPIYQSSKTIRQASEAFRQSSEIARPLTGRAGASPASEYSQKSLSNAPSALPDEQAVMQAYIAALGNFQQKALSVQEKIMISYLQDKQEIE